MVQYPLQRLLRNGPAEVTVGISEQMRIRQVENPDRITVSCVNGRLNKDFLSTEY